MLRETKKAGDSAWSEGTLTLTPSAQSMARQLYRGGAVTFTSNPLGNRAKNYTAVQVREGARVWDTHPYRQLLAYGLAEIVGMVPYEDEDGYLITHECRLTDKGREWCRVQCPLDMELPWSAPGRRRRPLDSRPSIIGMRR